MDGFRRALGLGWPVAVIGAALAMAAHGCSDEDDTVPGGGSTATGGSGGMAGSGGNTATGGDGGTGPEIHYECLPPTDIPDPWDIVIQGGNGRSGAPLEGIQIEILDASDAVVASGSTDASGQLPLSVPTGGMPIDGVMEASLDGYLTRRLHVQTGLGFGPSPSAYLWPESLATETVQDTWDATWDPATAMVAVVPLECNEEDLMAPGIIGARVSLSSPGLGGVYIGTDGTPDPALVHTTHYGVALFANVPAGDNEITVELPDGREVHYRYTLQAGAFESLLVYPRADAAICEPSDVSDFVPEWKPPHGLYPGICTEEQLTEYYDLCYGPSANSQACGDWRAEPGNNDCRWCVANYDDQPIWNGIVSYRHLGFLRIQTSQCVAAFEGDLSENSCGAWHQAVNECALEACKYSCPLRSETFGDDIALLGECEGMAKNDQCASYEAVAADCLFYMTAPNGPAAACNYQSGEDIWQWGFRLAGYLCGPDPGTGGGGAGGMGGAGGASGGAGGAAGGAGGAGGN